MTTKTTLSVLLAIFATTLAFSSCQNEYPDYNVVEVQGREQTMDAYYSQAAEIVGMDYDAFVETYNVQSDYMTACILMMDKMHLTEMGYVLDISSDEAAQMGVPLEMYQRCNYDLDSFNKELLKYPHSEWSGKVPENLGDFVRSECADRNNVSLKQEGLPHGYIETFGPEEGFGGFQTKNTYKRVQYVCLNKAAPMCIHSCRLSAFGAEVSDWAFGTIMVNRVILLDLPAAGYGVSAKVTYSVSDPNGGYCVWGVQDK